VAGERVHGKSFADAGAASGSRGCGLGGHPILRASACKITAMRLSGR
jgi:hypothetical protein